MLLITARPYTGGDAADWWQQAAAVAEIVREDYVPATSDVEARADPRQPQPPERVPAGGRRPHVDRDPAEPRRADGQLRDDEGLRRPQRPRAGRRRGTRWRSGRQLAAQQVAAETGIASVWSWGWGDVERRRAGSRQAVRRSARGSGRGRRRSATRRRRSAPGFDASRTEGQLSAARRRDAVRRRAGRRCRTRRSSSSSCVTGDRETGVQRALRAARRERRRRRCSTAERPRRRAGGDRCRRFGGSRAAYVAALAAGARERRRSRAAILGDQLRRAQVEATLAAPDAVRRRGPDLLHVVPGPARSGSCRRSPAPSWLGGKTQGLAISEVAPDRLFALADRDGRPSSHERRPSTR